jgi:hypothetical protein
MDAEVGFQYLLCLHYVIDHGIQQQGLRIARPITHAGR